MTNLEIAKRAVEHLLERPTLPVDERTGYLFSIRERLTTEMEAPAKTPVMDVRAKVWLEAAKTLIRSPNPVGGYDSNADFILKCFDERFPEYTSKGKNA